MQHFELFARRMPKDLFQNWPTEYERRESVIQSRNREMQKISMILDFEFKPMKGERHDN